MIVELAPKLRHVIDEVVDHVVVRNPVIHGTQATRARPPRCQLRDDTEPGRPLWPFASQPHNARAPLLPGCGEHIMGAVGCTMVKARQPGPQLSARSATRTATF